MSKTSRRSISEVNLFFLIEGKDPDLRKNWNRNFVLRLARNKCISDDPAGQLNRFDVMGTRFLV